MTRSGSSLFDLTGRVIVVAGGSRGIGFCLANSLSKTGALVFSIGRSVGPVAPLNGSASYLSFDLLADANLAMTTIIEKAGRIDGLVNCAGISLPETKAADEMARFRHTIDANLSAAYSSCLAAVPLMEPGSSIVNVTSINSVLGFPGNPGYVSSKGALRMLTRALAVDLGEKGIRVNSLAPGYIRTEMTSKSYADPIENERRRNHTCLGRWGEPEDLVGAAIFLLSDASAYVTGADIFVDGGWTAKGLV